VIREKLNKADQNPFLRLKGMNLFLPVVLGLGVVAWFFIREFEPGVFYHLQFSSKTFFFILVAFVCMMMRDWGYMIRLRILCNGQLSWWQIFRIIMLWEFTSAVTPSAVGGTSIAILYVAKEGISLGRSSAIVMATSFLDELYFVLMFPLLLLLVDAQTLFTVEVAAGEYAFARELVYFAVIGYLLKLGYVILVSYGLFYNPRGLKWLLLQIFRIPFLRRWRHEINDLGTDLKTSSDELKTKSFRFWLQAFGSTFFSWTARYWVVNSILLAFFLIPDFKDHFMIFVRQFFMWIMQLVSPTPGGSGFAELIFTRYLGEYIPGNSTTTGFLAISIAFMWRLISYYPYLVMGAIILPRWLKEKFSSSGLI